MLVNYQHQAIAGSRDNLTKSQRGVKESVKERNEKKELTEEEAALIIQKQVRGTIARKQYGTMVRSKTGKMDEETLVFMKQWCRRWKIKSMFQILLLYRAKKHHDLIYFCQQAHLYNQNSLSDLQDMNDNLPNLKEIDPKARPSTFLPPSRPSVQKIPFRLKDVPFFDSSFICDPSRGLRQSKPKDNEESWDAPLQRNIGEKYSRPARGLNFRDQGVQTMDKQEYGKFTKASLGSSLPETPFIREPGKAIKPPSDFRSNINNNQMGANMGKNSVYRGSNTNKKIAPQPPKDVVKCSRPGDKKSHPLREMEDKFRQMGDDEDAPFNFQAMLRKTSHTRESLKRGGEYGVSNKNNVVYTSYNNNNNNNNNYSNARRTEDRNRNAIGKKQVELAPGLVIHGEVADL